MKFRKLIWLAGTTLLAILLSACNLGTTPAPTEDPGVIQTQAFNIVNTQAASQQTQTAQAAPPTASPTNTPFTTATGVATFVSLGGTNTPFVFNTQQPGLTPLAATSPAQTAGAYSTVTTANGCNNGILISESPPYDGATILVGKEFEKSWEFLNTGTCTWDEGYSFTFRPEWAEKPDDAAIGYYGKDEILKLNSGFTKPGETRTFTVSLKAPNKPGQYTWYWRLKDDSGQLFGSLVWIKFISVEN